MKWIIAITSSLALNLILIFWGRGSFQATILSLIISFWIGLPLLAVSGIFFAIGSRRASKRFMTVGAWSLGLVLIIFSTMLSIPVGKLVLAGDMWRAKSFCESLIPALEQNKNQTGQYPKEISEMLVGQKPPRLVPSSFYDSDGTNFSFNINDPGRFMGWVRYMNQTKDWHRWD